MARSHLVSSLLAALWLLTACSTGGGSDLPTAPGSPQPVQVEFDSFMFLNDARGDNEVDPTLGLREQLSAIAREHSRRMRDQDFFGHVDAQGRSLLERLEEGGVSYRVAAENLARVTNIANPAAWVHDQLMQSDDHRMNILNPDFELAGVGVVTDGSTYWLTQVFIGR